MPSLFGQNPYQASHYGEPHAGPTVHELPSEAADDARLRAVLESLKFGDFDVVENLRPFLTHPSYDLRQYGHQPLAHVCNDEQVAWLADVQAEDREELNRLIVRLGETLSANALPLLRQLNEDFGDDEEVCDHLLIALQTLGDPALVDAAGADSESIRTLIQDLESVLLPTQYYYKGRPAFAGDLTKEVATAALAANREKPGAVIVRQHFLLANFTGTPCPIAPNRPVSDADVDGMFAYIERVAQKKWKRGSKYFYGHEISR